MGIPIGKLILYTACAGISPSQCLPVAIDVGTNNTALLGDPLYLGLHQRRLRGKPYNDLLDEFISAVTKVFPEALIQFEDFAHDNAFHLLRTYRDRVCCFNDDIQGTAAVVLAGLIGTLRITGQALTEQKLLFFGAGEAGIGIANLIVSGMAEQGLPEAEAREHCWFIDSKGLVVKGRVDLAEYKRPFAHDHDFLSDRRAIVEAVRPTALIGVTGKAGAFSQPLIEAAARINPRPIVFALSNPTSNAECTAEEAYRWTNGRAVFASGSPFDPVTLEGKTFIPSQGNNAYIFPGVGLGVMACGSRLVTDEMFLAAAHALADQVSNRDLSEGRIYPRLSEIRRVSASVAMAVVETARRQNLATREISDDLHSHIKALMFDPQYPSYA